jgi:hypothetical protein
MLIKDIDPNLISETSGAVNSAKDITGAAGLGGTSVQLGANGLSKFAGVAPAAKIASKAAKFVPFAGAAYNAADAVSRYQQGDNIGAALSGAGVIPALSLPAMGIQFARDKYYTGSWAPNDNEIAAAYGKMPAGGDPKVFALQQKLIKAGSTITADGKMGPATQTAMKQFGITAESLAESVELDRIKSLTSTLLKG